MTSYLSLSVATLAIIVTLLSIALLILGMMFMGLVRKVVKLEISITDYNYRKQSGLHKELLLDYQKGKGIDEL